MVNTNFGLQNVVLSLQSNGTYKEYLVSYNLSRNQLKDFFIGKFYGLKRNIKITPINSNFSSLLEKVVYQDECVIIKEIENKCASGQHSWGEQCTFENPDDWPKPNTYTTELLNCNTAGSNSSPTNDGTGGGGTSDGSQVTTSPTICKTGCIELEDSDDEPCKQLQDSISGNSTIMQKLKALRDHSLDNTPSGNREKGLRIRKDPNTGEHSPGSILTSNDENHVKITIHQYVTAIAHTHPQSEAFAMFSTPDILKMAEIAIRTESNTTINPLAITHILIVNGTYFAIKFDDLNSINKLKEIYLDSVKRERFEKRLLSDYESTHKPWKGIYTSIGKQQRELFNFLKDFNLNISLYQANDANGIIDSWNKINDDDNFTKQPCN